MAHLLSRLVLPFVPLLVVAGVGPVGALPLQVQPYDPLDRSCPGCDLRQADFRQAHLIGADFRGSDLRSADQMGLTEIRLAEVTAWTAAVQRIMGFNLKRNSTNGSHTGNNQQGRQRQHQPRKQMGH